MGSLVWSSEVGAVTMEKSRDLKLAAHKSTLSRQWSGGLQMVSVHGFGGNGQ